MIRCSREEEGGAKLTDTWRLLIHSVRIDSAFPLHDRTIIGVYTYAKTAFSFISREFYFPRRGDPKA